MAHRSIERWRSGLRVAALVAFVPVGLVHLAAPERFEPVMPPIVPRPRAVILFTGVAEILGALALLVPPARVPRLRRAAGIGLAAYAVCVFPANIRHARLGERGPPPSSWWYHAPRLAFQPVFVWGALFAGGLVAWPFRGPGRDA